MAIENIDVLKENDMGKNDPQNSTKNVTPAEPVVEAPESAPVTAETQPNDAEVQQAEAEAKDLQEQEAAQNSSDEPTQIPGQPILDPNVQEAERVQAIQEAQANNPVQTDNRERPEDGPQDVSQDPNAQVQ